MIEKKLHLSKIHLSLLVNDAAGNKDTDADVANIRSRIEKRVQRFTLRPIAPHADVAEVACSAVQDGADIVAVLGGDGTQSTVAGALAGGSAIMAVLPGGTFNYFARELGMGNDLDQALDVLEAAYVKSIDLGEVNGRVFLNNASFGVYPAILERREAIYRQWGRSRLMAYWSVAVTLADMRHPMRLRVTSGAVIRKFVTPLAFAARSSYQIESFGLEGAEAVRSGHFALFIARSTRRRDLAAAALRLALGMAVKGTDFEMVVADDILIESDRARRLLAFDGEKEWMPGPWHLKLRRQDLRVIVPPPDVNAAEPEAGQSAA
ncbi:diacylglycerol/lipid kinase family protein [Castellaniella sp.]|uniref:diacylglycerol/lipid kinase family protein n=1 Tax=Castellaniella sp. TaxID=1955812 RepID=UPI002AFFD401|nr:diacylglycerol kinase family protein [Castellaniella sp.]